jgi:mono/diheme cytochrome c family protein
LSAVTEIPEHLLKRSRERRAALGGESAEGAPAESESAATPAPVAAATPARAAAAAPPAAAEPPTPPPPKPDPPYIQAAKRRKKMPIWAMGALSLLPIWGFMYVRGMQPDIKKPEGPIADGTAVYSGCSSCHGSDGSGGAGRPLNNNSVITTFPNIEDQLNLVYTGSQAYKEAGLATYGDPNRAGGAHSPGSYNGSFMPQQGEKAGGGLSDAQILAVVCHERYDIGGASKLIDQQKWADEFAKWCAPDSEVYAGLKDGSLTFDTIEGVGTTPRASVGAK